MSEDDIPYHTLPAGSKSKHYLRKWDHAAIYWHIAGSYSPVTLMALRQEGAWGIGIFCFIWAAAIGGSVCHIVAVWDMLASMCKVMN